MQRILSEDYKIKLTIDENFGFGLKNGGYCKGYSSLEDFSFIPSEFTRNDIKGLSFRIPEFSG